jgi:hypothetical protein
MTNLTVTDIIDGQRFDGEFRLGAATCSTPTTDEQAYIKALGVVMGLMARDSREDPPGIDEISTALKQARTERRKVALKELRDEAADVLEGRLSATIAANNAFVIRGQYRADIDRQTKSFFLVQPVLDRGQIIDMIITVSSDLPTTRDPAAQAKQGLYVALDSARTVVSTVAGRLEDRS